MFTTPRQRGEMARASHLVVIPNIPPDPPGKFEAFNLQFGSLRLQRGDPDSGVIPVPTSVGKLLAFQEPGRCQNYLSVIFVNMRKGFEVVQPRDVGESLIGDRG